MALLGGLSGIFGRKEKKEAKAGLAKAVDPVCKMQVDTANPPGGTSDYQGTTYYFCALGCKKTFDQDPARYVGP